MCLLAIAWQAHAEYPLVVCANRDEFLARPTQSAHFWHDAPDVYAGRDLLGGGTWMGISRQGRFAALTNIRDPASNRDDARSRGLLVSRFLQGRETALGYCRQLQRNGALYNGYNFIAFDGNSLVYQSNALGSPRILPAGVHGISNAVIDVPWPKIVSASNKLTEWLKNPTEVKQLAMLMQDRRLAPDEQLPTTGVTLDLERGLSAEYSDLPGYATRCSTGLMLHRSGHAQYCEITHQQSCSSRQLRVDGFC